MSVPNDRGDPFADPVAGVFEAELRYAIDAMLDRLLIWGCRIERFAFANDGRLPDGSPVHGARSTGYDGIDGVEALAQAAVFVLEADDEAGAGGQ
jgi:hypothetical protein